MPRVRRPGRGRARSAVESSEDEEVVVDVRGRTSGHVLGHGGDTMVNTENGRLLANAGAVIIGIVAAFAFLTFVLQATVVVTGVVNPTWQTFKALSRSETDDDDEGESSSDDPDYIPSSEIRGNWLCYWVIAALLYTSSQVISLSNYIPIASPLLPAMLVPALLFLTRDNAKFSRRLYDDTVQKVLYSLEGHVDDSIEALLGHVEYYSSLALVKAYATIEPYTTQFRRAARESLMNIQHSEVRRALGNSPSRRRSRRSS